MAFTVEIPSLALPVTVGSFESHIIVYNIAGS